VPKQQRGGKQTVSRSGGGDDEDAFSYEDEDLSQLDEEALQKKIDEYEALLERKVSFSSFEILFLFYSSLCFCF
jgi:hypothetical protein